MKQIKKILSIGPLLIAISALLWALDGVIRRSLYVIPPLHIVFYEHLIGSLILFPVFIKNVRSFFELTKREIYLLCIVGLLSSVLGTLWFTTALLKVNYIPFSVVFLLQKLQPVFVIITASVFLHEKITKKHLQFGGLAILAAYFVTFPNGVVNFQTGSGTLIAAGYALLAAIAWGTSTVFSRMLLLKKPSELITVGRFYLATLFALALIFVFKQESQLVMVTTSQVARFFVIALSTGMVALAIYYKGLSKTPANISTVVELIFPVTAVLIDTVVYKSSLYFSQYIAALLLVWAAYKMATLPFRKVRFTTIKVKGKGRGKQMGFPTINMMVPKNLELEDGIYASKISFAGKTYIGALHFGPIPVFGDKKKSLEVFLLNTKKVQESWLEKSTITVEIISYIRPVLNFDSVDLLVDQIKRDVVQIRNLVTL